MQTVLYSKKERTKYEVKIIKTKIAPYIILALEFVTIRAQLLVSVKWGS